MDNYSSQDPEFLKTMRGGNSLVDEIHPDSSDLIQTNDRGLGKIWKDKMTRTIDSHLEENWDRWFGTGVTGKENFADTVC